MAGKPDEAEQLFLILFPAGFGPYDYCIVNNTKTARQGAKARFEERATKPKVLYLSLVEHLG